MLLPATQVSGDGDGLCRVGSVGIAVPRTELTAHICEVLEQDHRLDKAGSPYIGSGPSFR